ncbi:EAL domain-containing protein [Alcaligenaceae bacterium CGII-47]|nr:EAL domain-containing protein [Alcaligenaceae bacterium CGII-47]
MANKNLFTSFGNKSPVQGGRIAYFSSYFLIPLAIILSIMAAALTLKALYPQTHGQVLSIHALADVASAERDPLRALERLEASPARFSQPVPTGLSWLLINIPPGHADANEVLIVPSAYIAQLSCWLAPSLELLGESDRISSVGEVRQVKLGFGISLNGIARPNQILCASDLALPDVMVAQLWPRTELTAAVTRFSRSIGILEGGLLTLALFLGIIAITTREWTYILLAAWLVGNLRVGAWLMGWDTQWLGYAIPAQSLPGIRKFTVVIYYLLTYSLFTQLFKSSLSLTTYTRLQTIGHWSAGALLVAALVLPYQWFQPVIFLAVWMSSGLIAVTLVYALGRIHSRIWLWHIIGLLVAVLIMLLGIVLVGFGHQDAIDIFCGTIVLLITNIMVTLSGAEHTREERRNHIRERNELIAADTLTPFGLFSLNSAGVFEHMNGTMRQALEIDPQDALHASCWTDYFEAQDWHQIIATTQAGKETQIDLINHADTPARSFSLRATRVGSHIEGSVQDISARTETLRKLRLMEDSDPLTNSLSRRGIEAATDQAITELAATGAPCALAYLNLDHLKRINDMFGHTAGDELLQIVSERIYHSLNETQKMGHIGSDEFVILFPNTKASDAQKICRDILESLNSAALYVGSRAFQLKSAMGIIDVHAKMNAKDAISAASRACREARKNHRDVMLYEDNASELFEHTEELRIFDQLEGGSPPRDLYLEMQPILSLKHPLQTLNFEVLLRVRQTNETRISTAKIIQAAEDSGMISIIDKWVFSTTLDWIARHHEQLEHSRVINVNLSGVSLNDDLFIDALFAILNHHPQFTRRLCVEITEGVALQDLERTRQFMRRLQRMGARVALDDFGAGYTSFSYLKALPADTIKIDGSLIRDMLSSKSNIAIVGTIVELAHNLGMECIAEWVEDIATLEALSDMGVDYVQGFIVSASRPPTDILACSSVLDLVDSAEARRFIEVLGAKRLG